MRLSANLVVDGSRGSKELRGENDWKTVVSEILLPVS